MIMESERQCSHPYSTGLVGALGTEIVGEVQGGKGAQVGQGVAGTASSVSTTPSACTSMESIAPTGEEPGVLLI